MNRVHHEGAARVTLGRGGASVLISLAFAEKLAATALQEEWSQIDPATGRVLSTVDGYDVQSYEDVLLAEELGPEAFWAPEVGA